MPKTIVHTVLLIALIIFVCSCGTGNTDENYADAVEQEDKDAGYKDGTWCADVEYYNPNTGTRNTYQLNVEVKSNELIQIDWPNGGWLDETHFSAEDISDGECSFTSDRGYEFTVTLNSEEGCSSTGQYRLQNDIEQDQQDITCPECGGSKSDYDDLCYSCERKKKRAEEAAETCPVCYGYKMEWDKICDNCKEEREEKIRLEEEKIEE